MISLDDFHAGAGCWCNPEVETVFANDGNIRDLIIHNKADVKIDLNDPQDAEMFMLLAEMCMEEIDTELAKWWAVHEYAKLGS